MVEIKKTPMIFLRPVPGFVDYFASKDGNIYSKKTGVIKKKISYVEKSGYVTVQMATDPGIGQRYRVHRLVASSWLQEQEGKIVNHIDGNKQNNAVDNLEYVTIQENSIHAFENGLIKSFAKPVVQYNEDKIKISEYKSIRDAASKTGVNATDIGSACSGKLRTAGGYFWTHLGDKLNPRAHGNAKIVLQYDKKGVFIEEYDSLRSASGASGVDLMGICNACNGKQKSSGGYIWKYKQITPVINKLDVETKDWHSIQEYPMYKISRDGRIFSTKTRSILRQQKNGSASYVGLRIDNKTKSCAVHRLVATAYIPNPKQLKVVNHINGDQYDNRIENLEWCSHSENSLHASLTGLFKTHNRPVIQKQNGVELARFRNIKDASVSVNLTRSAISAAVRGVHKTAGGYTWEYTTDTADQGS